MAGFKSCKSKLYFTVRLKKNKKRITLQVTICEHNIESEACLITQDIYLYICAEAVILRRSHMQPVAH